MQDLINKEIFNSRDAKNYIDFIETQYIYHPNDCATSIVNSKGDKVYSKEQAEQINKRNKEIFKYLKCPYKYILAMRETRNKY